MTRALVLVAVAACGGRGVAGVTLLDAVEPMGDHHPALLQIALSPVETWIHGDFYGEAGPCRTSAIASGCTLTQCPIDDYEAEFDAGRIDIVGGAGQRVAIDPMTNTLTVLDYQRHDLVRDFVDGEALAVSAVGGSAPAFETALSVPALASATRLASTMIDTTGDLALAWMGGTGDVEVALGEQHYVACTFPASAGGGVIPSAALAMLASPTADGTTPAVLSMSSIARSTLAVGRWDLTVEARVWSTWADDGTPVSLDVTLK